MGFGIFLCFCQPGLWIKWNGKMILNQIPGNNIIDSENIELRPDMKII